MQFHALGVVTIFDRGEEVGVAGPRLRRLLAMLLIHRNTVVSVDRLADAVFAGAPTPAASTTLRSYVARLRRVVEANGSDSTLVTHAPGYVLRVPADAFDVACFEALLGEGRARLARDDAAGALSVLREALGLWRGDAYSEFADEDWARPEAQRLGELRLVAHERLIEAGLACGRAMEMIPELEALVDEHPLRESFRMQLMVALYRAGRQVDALRLVREYRQVLVEELGLDPSPAMVELERRVLTHDPTLMLAEPPGLPVRGYRLAERLGTGRDGTVYAARVPGVERDFAIRVIRGEIADCPEFVRSFEAAAHQLVSLRHPAIVPIHDYWREPGAAYLVMRRMTGGTLSDVMQRGPLAAETVAKLALRVGGALAAAAEQGIVHGRVTPHSVLFDAAGDPFLTDFPLGRSQPTRTSGDDVHDFAVLLRACLADEPGAVGDVLARGVAMAGRPAMTEFVPMVVAAIAGDEAPTEHSVRNPYKGLRCFDEADAGDFFGRDDLVEEILRRLGGDGIEGRLVLLVGGSGTGKSSVVRAGVLPRVRRGDVAGSQQWFVATMLPGSSPFEDLADCLQHVAVAEIAGLAEQLAADQGGIDRVIRRIIPGDGQLLLVVDQFEELFTLAAEQDQRAFLDALIHAVSMNDSRLRIVATMRADFFDRPLGFQGFGAAVNEATVTIAAMSPSQLEAAIVAPAAGAGRSIDPSIVAELVTAVVNQPAALPSLQLTLFELAERSGDGPLTLAGYKELGGVDGAIAARAELLYRSLDETAQAAVRRLFERLVVVGAEGESTRRRATRTELSGSVEDGALDALIDRWAQARLLTLDRHPQSRLPTVEVAHEALLREWPRLRRWIDDDRDSLVVRGSLREAAASWVELGRDPGALYRGARLEVALDAIAGGADDLPPTEREFLDASRAERDREQAQASEQAERQARANRRLRIQLVALAAALVVALGGGFVAVDQQRDAQRERRVATARELASAADANLDDDPERSMLLALAAIDEARSTDGTVRPEAVEALHRAVNASRKVLSVPGVGGSLDWSPANDTFVTEGPEASGLIDVRDAETGESVRSWHGHDVDVNDVAFSQDGSMLATTGADGAVRVWDPTTGDLISEFRDDERSSVYGPSFSPDGATVTASFLDVVRVIDVDDGGVIAEIESEWALDTAISPDGGHLAVADLDRQTVGVFDATSGEELFELIHADGVRDVAWSADGRWIATAGDDGTARIWQARTGQQRFAVAGHVAIVTGVAWSPDSDLLATVSEDGTAKTFTIDEEGPREVLSLAAAGTSAGLAGVAFSADGERLMTGDQAVREVNVWDLSANGAEEWVNVAATPGVAAHFSPNNRAVIVANSDGAVSMVDVETGARVTTIGPVLPPEVAQLAVSTDGQLVAASGWEAPVQVWNMATGDREFTIGDEGDGQLMDPAWSGDGARLAVPFPERSEVRIVDRSGTALGTIRADSGFGFYSVDLSPDGRLAVVTSSSNLGDADPSTTTVQVWDWERGELVRSIDTPSLKAVFDSTGSRIATSRWFSGTAEIWDVKTGERLRTLSAPTEFYDLTFSSDGTTIATAHLDGSVRLWAAESGVQTLVLPGHVGSAWSVAFSPDGSMLVSSGVDGIVRVWALGVDDLIAIANDRLTRGFTDDECRQFLHVERCTAA